MLIDHIGMATGFTCLQYGLLYVLLPILGSALLGINGVWAGIAIAPVLTLLCMLLFVYQRFGKDNFPLLLGDMNSEIVVLDGTIIAESTVDLPDRVRNCLVSHQFTSTKADNAALVIGELVSCIVEKNKNAKKPVLIELSIFFEDALVQIIERDSGELFEFIASDAQAGELSCCIPGGQMKSQREGTYLVTTGYNRNIIQFSRW
jgi:anti-sigma regulatory factor (Ser/Thr protein kinase)